MVNITYNMLLMEQIHTVDATHPAPVEVGSLSHIFLQGFVHPSWCRIPSIDSTIHGTDIYIYICLHEWLIFMEK